MAGRTGGYGKRKRFRVKRYRSSIRGKEKKAGAVRRDYSYSKTSLWERPYWRCQKGGGTGTAG